MLSLEQYRRFALPSCKRLVQRAHECGAIVHLHNSEILVPYLLGRGRDSARTSSTAARPPTSAKCRPALGGKCCFSGNLDPIEVLLRGTPGEVAREAERIVRIGYSQGGYLFNTGEMNPRDMPVENMRAMIAAVRQASRAMGGGE